EDGIRDRNVTGVQTCALPILPATPPMPPRLTFVPEMMGRQSLNSFESPFPVSRYVPVPLRLPLPSLTIAMKYPLLVAVRLACAEIGRASCRERGWWGVRG